MYALFLDVFVVNCFKFPNQIPDSPRVSAECVDLLRGLLERDPQCRMSFDQFFGHSFIDLDRMPSAHSIEKAVSNITYVRKLPYVV